MSQSTLSHEDATTAAERFNQISRYNTTVTINTDDIAYAVGKAKDRETFRLYDPTDGFAFAGLLKRLSNGLDEPDDVVLSTPNDDSEQIEVYSLSVNPDERSQQLDDRLPEIRNSLTTDNVDYTDDNPRATIQDETDGFNTLLDFAKQVKRDDLQLINQHLSRTEVLQALFKYNNGVSSTLSLIDVALTERSDTDEDTSPFAVRELLLMYHNSL